MGEWEGCRSFVGRQRDGAREREAASVHTIRLSKLFFMHLFHFGFYFEPSHQSGKKKKLFFMSIMEVTTKTGKFQR